MMINVGICDDDLNFCVSFEKMINQISNELNIKIDIDIYQSGERLNEQLQKGYHYDLLFLDIELQSIKGMTIGETVREVDKYDNTYIFYVSSKSQYALQLFKTRPLDFLIKPIDYRSLKKAMQFFYDLYSKENLCFEFSYKKQFFKIPYESILYFESVDKKIVIHLVDGSTREFYEKLHNVELSVNRFFVLIHQSYLVNYLKIISLTYENVELINGEKLNISQSKRNEVRRKFLELRKKDINNV